jgi:hypothetical protein
MRTGILLVGRCSSRAMKVTVFFATHLARAA